LLACGVSRADAAKWEDEWRCAWAEKGWHRTSTRTEGDHNLDKELAYLTSLLVLCSFSSPLRSGLDVGTSRLCPWNLKKRRAISRSLSLSLSHTHTHTSNPKPKNLPFLQVKRRAQHQKKNDKIANRLPTAYPKP
jgi:hypothetical protein